MHGLDFGGYTEWRRPTESPLPIDFVIFGIAWGKYPTTYYDSNLTALSAEELLMTYGFYNGTQNWLHQAEAWLRLSEALGSKAIWLDWERSSNSVLADDPEQHANRALNILMWLKARFEGQVGIYSNFNDYVVYLQPHINAKAWPWWLAWPAENIDSQPGNANWWRNIDRPQGDYILYQYSWKGYAPDYGAINDKKSMDLNIPNPKINLPVWLGVDDSPEPPPEPDKPCRLSECLNDLRSIIHKYEV